MKKMYSENQIKDIVNKGIEDGSIHADPSTEVKVGDINAESSTLGQVIISDGEGGAEWGSELPSITGNADKVLKVNSGATGIEWGEAGGSEVIAYEGTSTLENDLVFTGWTLHRAIKDGNILWLVGSGKILNNSSSTASIYSLFSITLPSNISSKIYRTDGTTCDNTYVNSNIIGAFPINVGTLTSANNILVKCTNVNKLDFEAQSSINVNASSDQTFNFRIPIFLDIGTTQQ